MAMTKMDQLDHRIAVREQELADLKTQRQEQEHREIAAKLRGTLRRLVDDEELPILSIVTMALRSWRAGYNEDPARAVEADASGPSLKLTLHEGAIDFAERLADVTGSHRGGAA